MPEEKNAKRKKGHHKYLWIVVPAIIAYPSWLAFKAIQQDGASGDLVNTEKKTETVDEKEMTSIDLAQASGVKPVLNRTDGYYQLIAIVEGEAENKRLSRALSVIDTQRKTLIQLTAKHEELTSAGAATTEVDAKEKEVQTALDQNLTYMRDKYGYILERNYLLVPEESRLIKVNGEGSGEEVKRFGNFDEYQKFQDARTIYTNLLEEVVKASDGAYPPPAQKPIRVVPKGSPGYDEMLKAMEENAKIAALPSSEIDPELGKARKGLIADFGYDPDLPHQVSFVKSSFYVRRQD
ncbi:hypothetical protein V2O64_23480 [Verrucomicrobiaceae bacterium 227]